MHHHEAPAHPAPHGHSAADPAPHDAEAAEAVPGTHRWTTLVLLCVAQFMLILDITAVTVALPDLGHDLHLSREGLTWVITAYGLCFGGLMILGGRLADTFGAKRTLLTGLAVFTLASMATGLAPDATWLISGRIAQGIGAALLSPAALSIVTTTFHGLERTRAFIEKWPWPAAQGRSQRFNSLSTTARMESGWLRTQVKKRTLTCGDNISYDLGGSPTPVLQPNRSSR